MRHSSRKLDYLDFLQEGWRYTLEDGKLGYGGVVFNEMKGAFADPMRALAQGMDCGAVQGHHAMKSSPAAIRWRFRR